MEEEPSEYLFIHNAGLVILGPYLPRYFDLVGLTTDAGQFVDDDAAVRAIHLLQYLVSGRTETEEHLLVFNKIICGLDLNTAVSPGIDLTGEERDASESLLNAILQNWDKMSNSTIENLRGSFLLREGKINETADYWELTVGDRAYDVLLDFLPWTISPLSLPWMDKPVLVNWR